MSPCCQRREQPAVLDVLEVEPAQRPRSGRSAGRARSAAGLEDVAGVRAGLALARSAPCVSTQRLQKRPVVLRREELVQPGEELPDELLFLFLRLGLAAG